jgi:secreted PhoX family phosphatase
MSGCDSSSNSAGIKKVDTYASKSTSIAYPASDEEKRSINFAKKIDLPLQTVKTRSLDKRAQSVQNLHDLSYKTLFRTGQSLGSETFGLLKDQNDQPLMQEDGSPYICNGQFGGSGPDHTEFIEKDGNIFMITQFECQVGAIYQSKLQQDAQTGELTATDLKYISQKDYHGGYVHCAGMKTPWNSFLGSEEYEPNAADLNISNGSINTYYDQVAPYFGGDLTKANPYYYGWITEVKILNANGDDSYTKHYSMGRFAHELAYVMPDAKTVYLSDDGTNCAFYMYIADKAGDLSAGTLYAAKWKQTSGEGAGSADLGWIELGHATDAEIKQIVDSRPLFSDIFERVEPNADGSCPAGFTSIHPGTGHECLKVKEGMETAAAFLESRRYAALKGATTEFRKMEGITYDPDTKRLYMAISQIAKGMEDYKKYGKSSDHYDLGGPNDIKLSYNKCGAVYALDIDPNKKDANGSALSGYSVKNMYGLIAGIPKEYDENSSYYGNSCDINGIASPDNITYMPASHTLLIGEDTSYHQNDLLWSFDTETGKLTDRIASTPYGSETTSPMWQPNINGFTYINFVTQHPYGESDKDKIKNPDDVQSYVGYMQVDDHKTDLPSQTMSESDYSFDTPLRSVTFDNNKTLDFTIGYGSSAYHAQNDPINIVYALSDRGVNIDCEDDEDILGKDYCDEGKIFPVADFGPRIYKMEIDTLSPSNKVQVLETIALKDKDGNAISGVSNTQYDDTPYNKDGHQLAYDPNGLDTEAMVKTSTGDFWVAEEYSPSIVHTDSEGKVLVRYVPAGFEGNLTAANYTVEGKLPAILVKRHKNRGIESIALSPDESHLYFAMQSPLENPDKDTYKQSRFVRLFKMSIADPSDIQEYVYTLDTPDTFTLDDTTKQNKVKVSEMRAIGDDKLLVLERISKTTKIYEVDLAQATPLAASYDDPATSPTLEELGKDPDSADDVAASVLSKKLVFSTADWPGRFISKIEGIGVIGDYLFLINDNDFGIEGDATHVHTVKFK